MGHYGLYVHCLACVFTVLHLCVHRFAHVCGVWCLTSWLLFCVLLCFTLGAFLDIERVFDSTLIDLTTKVAKWHQFHAGWQKNHSNTCRWSSAWGHSTVSAVKSGCGWTHRRSQSEWLLHNGVCRWPAIFNSEKFPNTVSEFLQEALNTVQHWCDRTQLSFNPQKMVIAPFFRKRDFRGLKERSLSGHTHCSWLLRANTLDLFWTRDWLGGHSWKMWWIRPTGLFGPVKAHLIKPGD